MKIVNAASMTALDQRAIQELGLPALVLMERAALGVLAVIQTHFPHHLASVHILVGTGNNGGDGLALARLLHNQGLAVQVWWQGATAKRSAEFQIQFEINQALGVPMGPVAIETLPQSLGHASLIVDSLFGIGLSREVTGDWAAMITSANRAKAPVLAIDIPSGLQADTGQVLGVAMVADITVSCALPKWAHFLDTALDHVGKLEIVDIGIPPIYYQDHPQQVITRDLAKTYLPPARASQSHKGTYGRLAIVAGSLGMSGAAVLAAQAALETGVGLVHLFVPAAIQAVLSTMLPEVQVQGLPETDGALNQAAWPLLKDQLAKMDAVLLGPGLGRSEATAGFCQALFAENTRPLLLDADALYHLAADPGALKASDKCPLILTPHPGEMATLLGYSGAEIQADRVTAVQQAAQRYQAVAVLKGARSLIANSAQQLWFNSSGNPGMARGGMGDLLAGLIAGLLAQGFAPESAAALGVYWHGLAGNRVAQEQGPVAVSLQRLLAQLPAAWQQIAAAKR